MIKDNSSYIEKLHHPFWQKKRLEIFQRDSWRCQLCASSEDTLHVHHRYYDKKYPNPWDYPNESLITLCEICHFEETQALKEAENFLLKVLKMNFFAHEIKHIANGFSSMKLSDLPNGSSIAIESILRNHMNLIERFFEDLIKNSQNKASTSWIKEEKPILTVVE